MVYNVRCEVEWGDDDHPYGMYQTVAGVRATSRTAALNKAVDMIEKWPCYAERVKRGCYVRGEATIVEGE